MFRRALEVCTTAAILATFSAQPAFAAQASAEDRARMSLAIADYINLYGDKGGLQRGTDIGWAVVELPWALVRWNSFNNISGAVLLKSSGGKWSVEDVSTTIPPRYENVGGFWHLVPDAGSTAQARTRHLVEQGVPASTAARLVADLAAFNGRRDPWLWVHVADVPENYRPQYLAIDYAKPGHPKLTAQEIAQIRKVLAVIRPCQRALLEYAFPENEDFILFFENNGSPHPIGESGNSFYNETQGQVDAASYDGQEVPPGDLQYDIAHARCGP